MHRWGSQGRSFGAFLISGARCYELRAEVASTRDKSWKLPQNSPRHAPAPVSLTSAVMKEIMKVSSQEVAVIFAVVGVAAG